MAVIDDALYTAVGEPGAGGANLWRIDPESGQGAPFMPLEGVQFANGLTPLAPDKLLLAESWQGVLS